MKTVVKIGTSTLAHATGRLNIKRIEQLCKVLSDLKNAGHEIILVSSGAIGMGVGKLGLPSRPRDTAGKQAAAAVGQCELMYTYDKLFAEYNHTVAQILLTAEDLRHADRHQNFENTMSRLLALSVLPIINENDTVATEEIEIGDNDTLAAIVAESTRADLLIIGNDLLLALRIDLTLTAIVTIRKIQAEIHSIRADLLRDLKGAHVAVLHLISTDGNTD